MTRKRPAGEPVQANRGPWIGRERRNSWIARVRANCHAGTHRPPRGPSAPRWTGWLPPTTTTASCRDGPRPTDPASHRSRAFDPIGPSTGSPASSRQPPGSVRCRHREPTVEKSQTTRGHSPPPTAFSPEHDRRLFEPSRRRVQKELPIPTTEPTTALPGPAGSVAECKAGVSRVASPGPTFPPRSNWHHLSQATTE